MSVEIFLALAGVSAFVVGFMAAALLLGREAID